MAGRLRLLIRRWSPLPSLAGVEAEIVWGDLSDEASLKALVDGADAVVHAAGLIKARRPPTSWRSIATARRSPVGAGARRALPPAVVAGGARAAALALRRQQAGGRGGGRRSLRTLATVRAPAVYGPGDRETLAYFKPSRAVLLCGPTAGCPAVADPCRGPGRGVGACRRAAAVAVGLYEIDDGQDGGYGYGDMAKAAAAALGRPVARFRRRAGVMNAVARLNQSRRPVQILTPGKVREIFHSDWTVHDRRLAAGFPRVSTWPKAFATRSCGIAGTMALGL